METSSKLSETTSNIKNESQNVKTQTKLKRTIFFFFDSLFFYFKEKGIFKHQQQKTTFLDYRCSYFNFEKRFHYISFVSSLPQELKESWYHNGVLVGKGIIKEFNYNDSPKFIHEEMVEFLKRDSKWVIDSKLITGGGVRFYLNNEKKEVFSISKQKGGRSVYAAISFTREYEIDANPVEMCLHGIKKKCYGLNDEEFKLIQDQLEDIWKNKTSTSCFTYIQTFPGKCTVGFYVDMSSLWDGKQEEIIQRINKAKSKTSTSDSFKYWKNYPNLYFNDKNNLGFKWLSIYDKSALDNCNPHISNSFIQDFKTGKLKVFSSNNNNATANDNNDATVNDNDNATANDNNNATVNDNDNATANDNNNATAKDNNIDKKDKNANEQNLVKQMENLELKEKDSTKLEIKDTKEEEET